MTWSRPRHSDAHWRELARREPYHAVFADPRFSPQRLDEAARREFFASGEEHAARLWEWLQARAGPDFRPRRGLDFGCGVGRVTLPLARRLPRVIGADVAPAMLAEAQAEAARQGVANVEWVCCDAALTGLDGGFDLIHSFVVFQHVPRARGLALLRALIARLEPGGVALLHVLVGRAQPAWRRAWSALREHVPGVHALANLLRGRDPGAPLALLESYPLVPLLEAAAALGTVELPLRLTRHGGALGALLLVRRPRPGEREWTP